MSEHVTHVAISQDVRRLVSAGWEAFGLPPEFARSWDADDSAAQLGGITRSADTYSVELLETIRPGGRLAEEPQADAKLAFVLGSLTHRAADRHMKPVFKHFREQDDYRGFNECTMYCDVFMLLEAYAGPYAHTDAGRTFPQDMLEKGNAAEAIEPAVTGALRRSLIRMHTFIPADDRLAWVDALLAASQKFHLSVEEYVRIFASPDPAKWKRYLLDTNFYNKQAPLVRVMRQLRVGGEVSGRDVAAAVAATGIPCGRYPRAAARAVDYIKAAGRFWRGEADADATRKAFDIGVPEHSLAYPDPA